MAYAGKFQPGSFGDRWGSQAAAVFADFRMGGMIGAVLLIGNPFASHALSGVLSCRQR